MKKIYFMLFGALCFNAVNSQTCTPTITASSNPICAGETVTLTANGATSYTWMPAGATTNVFVGNPGTTTVYTLIASLGACSSASTVQINVAPTPTIDITASNTVVCSGSTITLTAIGSSSNYIWNTGETTSSIAISSAGIYSVTMMDNCGSATASIQINSDVPPTINVMAASSVVCAGSATSLTAIGANNYCWSPGSSVSDSLAPDIAAFPTVNTTYTVTGYNAGGCHSQAMIALGVVPSPIANYTLQPDATPHVWNLYPSVSGGVGSYTYDWSWGDNSPNSTVAYPSHTYSVAGTYYITLYVTDANGCGAYVAHSENVFKTANTNDVQTMVQVNVVDITTGVQPIKTNSTISVYPNPASEKIYIDLSGEKELSISLFDVTGKLIINKTINANSFVDISFLNNGSYTLTIKTESGAINKKITIIR